MLYFYNFLIDDSEITTARFITHVYYIYSYIHFSYMHICVCLLLKSKTFSCAGNIFSIQVFNDRNNALNLKKSNFERNYQMCKKE